MSCSRELGAFVIAVPDDRLHREKVDDALEGGFRADRQLQRHRARAQFLLDVVKAHEKVGASLVHLVGEDDARHAVLVALAPDGLGLGLHTLVAVEHAHGAVEHPQRALHLDCEVDVAWRVDDVQSLALPEAGCGSRRDGDAALGLLLHEIHGRGAVMHFTDLVVLARVKEDPLRSRGLPGIDVSHDAKVAVVLDFMRSRHRSCSNHQR